jgi:hypothetical protein
MGGGAQGTGPWRLTLRPEGSLTCLRNTHCDQICADSSLRGTLTAHTGHSGQTVCSMGVFKLLFLQRVSGRCLLALLQMTLGWRAALCFTSAQRLDFNASGWVLLGQITEESQDRSGKSSVALGSADLWLVLCPPGCHSAFSLPLQAGSRTAETVLLLRTRRTQEDLGTSALLQDMARWRAACCSAVAEDLPARDGCA